jgi:hypothetical protein
MTSGIQVLAIEFTKGYHVGWIRSEEIIDHLTILRSLIEISGLTQHKYIINAIVNGKLKSTALLPTHICKDTVKLLAPIPVTPLGLGVKKEYIRWSTLPAIKHIVEFAEKCVNKHGFIVLESVSNREIVYKCRDRKSYSILEDLRLELRGEPPIVCLTDIDCDYICPDRRKYLEYFYEIRTRIDRITGSADVYRVEGVQAHTPLWLALISSEEHLLEEVVKLMHILGDMGIGGYRSKGFGKFKTIDVKVVGDDLEILKKYTIWKEGYAYLLGSLPSTCSSIVTDFSYSSQRMLEGIGGNTFNQYYLPVIRLLDVGSLLYFERGAKEPYYVIKLSPIGGLDHEPLIVFNPVMIHGF